LANCPTKEEENFPAPAALFKNTFFSFAVQKFLFAGHKKLSAHLARDPPVRASAPKKKDVAPIVQRRRR